MKNRRLYIIHFHPLFYYPPTQNLINFFLEKKEKLKIVTTLVEDQKLPRDIVDITSYVFIRKKLGGIQNIIKQVYFNIYTLLSIIKYKPTHIIYYETLSALPALFYKKYISKKVKIICHYHELNAKNNIISESRSTQIIRNIEKKNYKNFEWISQTNELRKSIFINDYGVYLDNNIVDTLANYPPKKWGIAKQNKHSKNQVNFVLVGSIHVDKMYLFEFCNLLEKQNFNFKFDIYSFEIDVKTKEFIDSKSYINYRGSISYDEIPFILKEYDVGVILYKPLSINITNCASNKLFEYHACGLDVLFPSSMIYSKTYITHNTYPLIKEIDFENYEAIDLNTLLNKKDLEKKLLPYTAEEEFEKLYQHLLQQ